VVAIDRDESDEHVDRDQEGGEAGEETEDQEYAAHELGEGGDVAEPSGEAKRRYEVGVVVECAVGNDFRVAVIDHRRAEDEAQKKSAEGLQAVEPLDHVSSVDAGLEDLGWSLAGGCRGRYEGGDGGGGQVLVEKTCEALVIGEG
jgi:hypothetical protein